VKVGAGEDGDGKVATAVKSTMGQTAANEAGRGRMAAITVTLPQLSGASESPDVAVTTVSNNAAPPLRYLGQDEHITTMKS
jgi:hypothetical protein